MYVTKKNGKPIHTSIKYLIDRVYLLTYWKQMMFFLLAPPPHKKMTYSASILKWSVYNVLNLEILQIAATNHIKQCTINVVVFLKALNASILRPFGAKTNDLPSQKYTSLNKYAQMTFAFYFLSFFFLHHRL